MKRQVRRRSKIKRFRHAPPGTSPGMITIREDALLPKIKAFEYGPDYFREIELKGLNDIKQFINDKPDRQHWIDIRGLGDKIFLEELSDYFGIHRLQMEDVVNSYQRPKMEDYENHLFVTSRCIRETDAGIIDEQLSLFVGKNYVLSLQEKYHDLLDPVRERIRNGKGYVRQYGPDYLAYILMDTVLDNFYPVLEHLGDKLDDLQDELLSNPTRNALDKVLFIKRELILLRRVIWSERDKINDVLRSNLKLVTDNSKLFFKDSYDHCIQILDLVESYREVTASLMDVYHSSVSNRLNQVMKVLTIISTIFIPLTFIVGLYGMNFAHTDIVTGKKLPLNMPELYSPYGYITVLVVMIVIVILQLIFFFRKGWLSRS